MIFMQEYLHMLYALAMKKFLFCLLFCTFSFQCLGWNNCPLHKQEECAQFDNCINSLLSCIGGDYQKLIDVIRMMRSMYFFSDATEARICEVAKQVLDTLTNISKMQIRDIINLTQ